jgi:hypothetical protein
MRKRVLLGVLWLAGCSGFGVRSGPEEPIPGPDTGPVQGAVGRTGETSASSGASRQTVCRSAGRPRGWVAVDYVAGGSTCGNEGYTAMVLQRLAPLPQGTLLIVCAGQSIPGNWKRVGGEDISSGQCPRNADDRRTGPTVMQIERTS